MQSSCDLRKDGASANTAAEGIRACVLYQNESSLNAARALCSQYEWDTALGPIRTANYSFDTLRNAEGQNAAVQNAIHANLLIVAVSEGDLPSIVRFWMGKFIGAKSSSPCTLVALTQSNGGQWNSSSPAYQYLAGISALARMPFASHHFETSDAKINLSSGGSAEQVETPRYGNIYSAAQAGA